MFILGVWVVAALILTNLSEIFFAFLVIPLLILILMWLNDMIKLLAGSFLDADDRPVNKWH